MHPATRLYQSREALGLCPLCGKSREDEKYKLCESCRRYHRGYYKAMIEKQTPEEHREFNARKGKTQRARAYKRRAQGLCVQCGAVSPVHWLCETCYTNRKEKERLAFEADMLREAMEEEMW